MYWQNTTVIIFDVSFPEKLLKIVATRGEIFSLKFTKYRLAASHFKTTAIRIRGIFRKIPRSSAARW